MRTVWHPPAILAQEGARHNSFAGRSMVDEIGPDQVDVALDLLFVSFLVLVGTLIIKGVFKLCIKVGHRKPSSVVSPDPDCSEEIVLPSGQRVYLRHG